jgi:hypothetical protein
MKSWPRRVVVRAWRAIVKDVFNALLTLFTLVLAVTSILQWRAVRNTLIETRALVSAANVQANAANTQAAAALVQAKASADQAGAAKLANDMALEQFRTSFTGPLDSRLTPSRPPTKKP